MKRLIFLTLLARIAVGSQEISINVKQQGADCPFDGRFISQVEAELARQTKAFDYKVVPAKDQIPSLNLFLYCERAGDGWVYFWSGEVYERVPSKVEGKTVLAAVRFASPYKLFFGDEKKVKDAFLSAPKTFMAK